MHFRKILLLSLITWIASYHALAQIDPLFVDFSGTLTQNQQRILSNNLAITSTERNKAVVVDANIFEAASLRIELFDGQDIQFDQVVLNASGTTFKHWVGNLAGGIGTAAFILNGDRISGHFSGDFGNYELYPLDGGVHAFAKLDSEEFLPCGNEEAENTQPISPLPEQEKTSNPLKKSADGTECFIRLIVGYTSSAKNNTANNLGRTMNEQIGLAVLESNQGYANSGVESRVELAYSYETDDNETLFSGTDVNALQSKTDGKWDEIHGFRDDYDADMVCLVAGSYLFVCGQAFGFDYTNEANMFQVSVYNCIVGNYTFAHEFGHNQGCRHDNDNTQSPFTYARGLNDGTERTIMAVSSSPPRRNHWSNPDINFAGGGPTGAVDRDNARALDFGDEVVASHRTTPNVAVISDLVKDDETRNMVVIDQLTATNEVEAGGILELKAQGVVILEAGFHARNGSEFRAFPIPACTASYSITNGSLEDRSATTEPVAPTDRLSIAPNPATTFAQIAWAQTSSTLLSIQLQNAYGQTVQQVADHQLFEEGNHRLEMDVQNLASGLYYLVFYSDQKQWSKPVVVVD
ncbi:MAG: M12 family metallo-peptidase [Bacteroidota bacterium]